MYFISSSFSGRYFRLLDIKDVRISDIFLFYSESDQIPFYMERDFFLYQKKKPQHKQPNCLQKGFQRHLAAMCTSENLQFSLFYSGSELFLTLLSSVKP